ncbi:MAG: F0F1 ATP synthase subunit delta [Syntrophobacterales bacterium CG_4_9_14_3_um_filter_49_8]|nr:MAG: F0F1 ATP synthase subunit delta [Syntrophobacterales bacterium CG_4_9_14_3_um_filter_49_8]
MVIASGIAKRYARAFFGIAEENNQFEKYYEELENFASCLSENKNLKELLSNPIFDRADKKAVIEAALQRISVSSMTANFLKLLIDKQRMGIFFDIVGCYREFMDHALRKVRVDVKTAFPLSAELTKDLQKGLEELTGKKVEMTVGEDVSLVGGIVVRVGDTLYDGSVKTQLDNIGNILTAL